VATTVDDSKLQKRLKALSDSLETKEDNFIVGKFVIGMIKKRTRDDGKAAKRTGANLSKIKDVSKAWAERRAKLSKHPKAASGTKSNLTFRGTMLDDLSVVKATKNGFFIGFTDDKEELKAEGNEARGRPLMYLSKGEKKNNEQYNKKQILDSV